MKTFLSFLKHPIVTMARFLAAIDADKLRHKMAYLSFYAFSLIIFMVLLTVFLSYFIAPATLGVSGDFFGGFLNPIFNFFSLLALLFTLVLQTNEIKQARMAQQQQTQLFLSQKQLLKQQVLEQVSANKMTITLQLVKDWKEKDIHHHRQRVFFDMIEYGITPENIQLPHTVCLKDHDGDTVYHLTEIFEFIHDMSLMWQANKLDNDIFKEIFKDKLHYWFMLAENITLNHPHKQLIPRLRADICAFHRTLKKDLP